MLQIYTGRSRLLAPALAARMREDGAKTQLVVVPRQLTLQTERMLLEMLGLSGSFRMQILSVERLCGRIFEAAGQPEGVRVDAQGRVMLVRAAVRDAADDLTIYRGAEHRRGFAERAAAQLERFRQAGLTPKDLRDSADAFSGAARMKLGDLAEILENYNSRIAGRYQDGETEYTEAILRVPEADFLRESSVWFFGFSLEDALLYELIAAVGAVCPRAAILFPLENDSLARDYDAFRPMETVLLHLSDAARRKGARAERVDLCDSADPVGQDRPARRRLGVQAPPRKAALKRLEEELYAYPVRPASGAAPVQLVMTRNPQEECMFAAALTRRLVRQNGWRWSDVLILCQDAKGYAAPLRSAFQAYDVPLFQAESRSAARHVTSECLLTAIKVIEKGFPAEDMFALMRTGLMDVDADEANRLTNYAIQYGLRGKGFLTPLRRGNEAEIASLEPIRARFAAPLNALREHLRAAKTLQAQLKALFQFLTDIDACEKSAARMNALAEAGLREAAGEEGQVWNRILSAMDQMYALMGEKRLSLSELRETLTEALSASVIKALPQSGDAVYVQSADAACTKGVRAILLLGMCDSPAADDSSLLTSAQQRLLAQQTGAFLGVDDADMSRLSRFKLKSALGMASDYVCVSCALSGSDGAAQRPGAIFGLIESIFPAVRTRGGLAGDDGIDRMLRSAPGAALSYGAKALAAQAEGVPVSSVDRAALAGLKKLSASSAPARTGLERLSSALNRAQAADSLSPAAARALYTTLKRQSISRLEKFANCPFAYYVQYGLRPVVVQPLALRPSDEGTFFHEAVHEFLLRSEGDLDHLSAEAAANRMDAIAEPLLDSLTESGALAVLGDSAVSGAERRRLLATVRSAAVRMAGHMRGSQFHTVGLEQRFGMDGGADGLALPGGAMMHGIIDRVDGWNDGQEDYYRVIDFKRGGKDLKLDQAYYGLRLQLPIYLAATLSARGGKSAGIYYFKLKEDILNIQSTDRFEIEKERRKQFQLSGLPPADKAVLEAMTPDYQGVLKVSVKKDGSFYDSTVVAEDGDYDRLTKWSMRKAGEHLARIRAGECAVSPVQIDKKSPCAYCDMRPCCLFDERLDARRVRKLKPMKGAEVLQKLAEEEEK